MVSNRQYVWIQYFLQGKSKAHNTGINTVEFDKGQITQLNYFCNYLVIVQFLLQLLLNLQLLWTFGTEIIADSKVIVEFYKIAVLMAKNFSNCKKKILFEWCAPRILLFGQVLYITEKRL